MKESMGKWYLYSTRWEQDIVIILNIYGDTSISLLFCHHQDTEYDSYEIEMIISLPLFTHKKPKPLWDNNAHTLQNGGIILW